jgi:predicted ATPase
VDVPALTSVRVTAFKSYKDQQFPVEPLTLLVGGNGSGKSNALDALALLALLADERDVNDVERGDHEVAGLRGGLTGAAPFGDPEVRVGCSIEVSDGGCLDLDLTLEAAEKPEIISETLVLRRPKGHAPIVLVDAHRQSKGSGISNVNVYSGGQPRGYTLLSTRLASAQAMTKVPEDSKARRLVVSSCRQAVAALRGVFVLDPVPGQMRQYARIGSAPDRSGSTVSAMVYALRDDADAWSRLYQLVAGLMETRLREITFAEARLPEDRLVDVMVALVEEAGTHAFTAPAQLMSDGTLRYLAIVASLLSLRAEQPTSSIPVRRTLVVEEIENGLFPGQAAGVLNLLRSEAHTQGVRLIATTHSPALLDALRPDDHAGVIVCDRNSDGWSQLRRLVDHPRYVDLAGGAGIGRAVTEGQLELTPPAEKVSLAELFG